MKTPYVRYIRKFWRPRLESYIDDYKAAKDPLHFRFSGIQMYVGRQGSGKTISAVKHARKVKKDYPKAILVSNLEFLDGRRKREFNNKQELQAICDSIDTAKDYIFFTDTEQLALVLVGVNNGKLGVCYLIDEIQTYINSTESKSMPMFVFTEISQQRKQRKLILCTSQLFTRVGKPFREQCDNMIQCKTILGFFTMQFVYDGMSVPDDFDNHVDLFKAYKWAWFFHDRETRNAYDTYQKVVSGNEQMERSTYFSVDAKKPRQIFAKN